MPVYQNVYRTAGRLQDVLALIQILGYGSEPAYTPAGICNALQDVGDDRKPRAERLRHWEDVSRSHPEFFRVSGKGVSISLVARFVTGSNPSSRNLETDVVKLLMETAIDIHDREAKRNERWTLYLPLVIAIVGAIGAVTAALIGMLANKA